ncbi:MAG: hypothetical protein JWM11_6504 [Planctomycetaceae bacterium]|nr:hypothetical protein [Planctomycetaceae bacterium]
MSTLIAIPIGLLCLSIVSLTWWLIQKSTNLLFNSSTLDLRRELKEIGVGVGILAAIVIVTFGIAAISGA